MNSNSLQKFRFHEHSNNLDIHSPPKEKESLWKCSKKGKGYNHIAVSEDKNRLPYP